MAPLVIIAAVLAAIASSGPQGGAPDAAGASTDVAGAPTTIDKPVIHPAWTRLPSAGDFARLRPVRARGAKGVVTARCLIDEAGEFTSCDVILENPAGKGFGEATVKLSKLFKMKTTDGDGLPVAGRRLTLPVVWYPEPQ